jgi:pimeloyl-ACP methyl ester carboxylesterase
MSELVRDGVSLYFEAWGNAENPPVLLLHDLGRDLRRWSVQAAALADDFLVVAADVRGHGLSGMPDEGAQPGLEPYLADLGALLDELGAPVCALVGEGFGALISLHFACRLADRVAGLALVDWRDPNACGALCEVESALRRFGPAGLARLAARSVRDPFLGEALRQQCGRLEAEGCLAAIAAWRAAPGVPGGAGERLAMPVLVCCGDTDAAREASRAIADGLRGPRVVTFRDSPGGIVHQRPEALTRVLRQFFRDIEEGRPIDQRQTV